VATSTERFAIERLGNTKVQVALRELVDVMRAINDPHELRAIGQSLKLIGDGSRSRAFEVTRQHW